MNNVKISKMRFINWHKCSDSGVLDISGNTMLSGATGSGKSTAIDALYSTLFIDNTHLNKAANSRSKRDIKGYVRCQVNELKEDNTTNKYLRTGNIVSYVAIEIISEKNQKNTIGVCHHSRNENAPIVSHYFVIGNCKIEDVKMIDESNTPLDWNNFRSEHENKNGAIFRFSDTQQGAKQYFAAQLGFSNNGVDTYEKYGKAVANAIAFRTDDITNINTFFKNTLLKEDIIDIANVKEACERYDELKNNFAIQENRKNFLSDIVKLGEELTDIKEILEKTSTVKLIANQKHIENLLKELCNKREKLDEEIKRLNEKKNVLKDEKEELIVKISQMQNSEDAQKLKMMKDSLIKKEEEYQKVTEEYNAFINAIMAYNSCSVNLGNLIDEDITKIKPESIIQDSKEYTDFIFFLNHLVNKLHDVIAKNNMKSGNMCNENKKLDTEIRELENGMIPTDSNTKQAINLINKYYKENNIDEKPLLLYQCIDIKPEFINWQTSIESLFNKARFNVIVSPPHYKNIAQLFKNNNIENVSLIDTTALNEQSHIETPSICDMVVFKNEYAEKYIKYRYGKVIPVKSCINLSVDKSKTYIGEDGTSYATKSFNIPKKAITLYIGEDARLKLLKTKKEQFAENQQEISSLFENNRKMNSLKETIGGIILQCEKTEYKTFLKMQSLPAEIEGDRRNVNKFEEENNLLLHTEIINELNQKKENKQKCIEKIDSEITEISKQIGANDEKTAKQEENLENTTNLISTISVNNAVLYNEAQKEYIKLCNDKRKTFASISVFCDETEKDKRKEFNNLNTKLVAKQNEYMRNYNNSISCNGFESIEVFKEEYINVSTDGLPELKEQLEIAKMEQKTRIKEEVFSRLQHNVKETRTNIREFNTILGRNPFGDNTYKIQIIGAADGYEDLLNIVENYNPDAQLDLFSMDNTLQEDDFDRLIAEIENDSKKADYRNYLNIDIQVTKKIGETSTNYMLSKVIGTNSGGETQIPFYILCAIAILNVTNSKNVLQNMVKVNILDEAFDKMDTPSIQNLINFYTTLGFQTVLSAPDSKNEILSDIMDNRIAVLNKNIHRGFKNIASRAMLEFSKLKE